MFSLQLEVSLDSRVGKRLSLLQHLVSLSVVEAVKSLQNGYEKLDMRLKWPNDIYIGQNCKIGGVVIFSSIMGDIVQITIGCGVNLSNKEPTKCINQICIEQELAPISREVLLARIFNSFESFLDKIEDGKEEDVLTLYPTYWLHGQQIVKLKCAEDEMKVGKIVSLDSFGFLKA